MQPLCIGCAGQRDRIGASKQLGAHQVVLCEDAAHLAQELAHEIVQLRPRDVKSVRCNGDDAFGVSETGSGQIEKASVLQQADVISSGFPRPQAPCPGISHSGWMRTPCALQHSAKQDVGDAGQR